jgi:WD40 repeat protein
VTAAETLKIWTVRDNSSAELTSSLQSVNFSLLKNCQTSQKESCAPLTSFDWNTQYLNIICTCSVDTTCSIWDISTGNIIKQLIAHDKEVFDINFSPDANVFATVGADGSVRKFDSRDLSKSDIIYEHSSPILRLSWNKNNENYIAFNSAEKNFVTLIDIR